jgi:ABC-type proline/glycine betaine transport system ATPase subunit
MVTHNLREGLALASRVAVQVRGRFAWQGIGDEVETNDFERLYHRVVEGGS